MTIDLNCDLGELTGTGHDEAIMPWITSANIACGFHAGDALTMTRTVKLALKHNVSIGAHPGFPDRKNFGRRALQLSGEELQAIMVYQVGALKAITEAEGGKLVHVKPHGALYNMAAVNIEMALIIVAAVKKTDSSLVLFGLSGSILARAAEDAGLAFASEIFADRAYNDDGTLVPRNIPGAVLQDIRTVTERAIRMVTTSTVLSVTGKEIPIKADTICIHGDNEMATDFARKLNEAFKNNDIILQPPGRNH